MNHSRSYPISLAIMHILSYRMPLSSSHLQYLSRLQKGFSGELLMDAMTHELGDDFLILKDLSLDSKSAGSFQIDTLILSSLGIYLYEVKNYSGEFFYKEELIVKKPDLEIMNPTVQLQNTRIKLERLLKEMGHPTKVQGFVAYVHNSFTLFFAPDDTRVLLPTQLAGHFAELKKKAAPLTSLQKRMAKELTQQALHPEPFLKSMPDYTFTDLQKGIACQRCNQISLILLRESYTCSTCGYQGKIFSALIKAIKEYQLLFPHQTLSTNVLYEWCDQSVSKKRIKRAVNMLTNHEDGKVPLHLMETCPADEVSGQEYAFSPLTCPSHTIHGQVFQ